MIFHEAVARELARHGVVAMFGVIGDGNLFIVDSYHRARGGSYYSMANEAGAVLAASGYARVSGRLGVATVTHGPALTNAVTALTDAARARVPVLLVAGDTDPLDRRTLQDVDQRMVVLGTGARFVTLRSPETVELDVAQAIRTALVERLPVVLNVPYEYTWLEAAEPRELPAKGVEQQVPRPDTAAMESAVGVLASARRPVLLAGRGAADEDARAAILDLAGRIGAPVATTLQAKDLFRGAQHNLDIFGTLSHDAALEIILASDCIIAFGAGLNLWTSAEGSLLAGKRLVHVDIDPSSLNRWVDCDVAVLGDARTVAGALAGLLDEADVPSTGFAGQAMADRLSRQSRDAVTTAPTLDIKQALLRVEAAVPEQRTLVLDAGRFVYSAFKLLRVPHPSAYVHTLDFGSIGLSVGKAVGAYVAEPGRPVLLVTGDGGFMLGGMAEFNSAVRNNIDLVVVVLNDGAYGAEHVQFRHRDLDPELSVFAWPELASVATALGGRGFTATTIHELDDALAAIPSRDRPMLIDIRLDPDDIPNS